MSSSHQLALALFESMTAVGESINESRSEIGFRRNDILVEVVDMSLTARRAIDVAYFIVSQASKLEKTHVVDLNFFKWLMCYTSHNRNHLRSVLREGQKAAIQVSVIDPEDPESENWVSVQLLGSVGISKSKVFFEVDEKLQREIANPANSHFLSLRFVFKSVHAKIIYDRLQPYIADGVTPWFDLATLRMWLNCTGKTYDEFKYFKRSVLELAVKQVNEISNLNVEYETQTTPGSKKIGKLRFRVTVREEIEPPNMAMLMLKDLYEALKTEFGLSRDQMDEVLMNRQEWTDERIQQAIEYTRFQIEQGKVKKSASGYLMKALKEHYVVGTADLRIAQQAREPKPSAPRMLAAPEAPARLSPVPSEEEDQRRVASENKALAAFAKLPEAEQCEIMADFCRTDVAKLIASRKKVDRDLIGDYLERDDWVRTSFCAHFAAHVKPKKAKPETSVAPRTPRKVAAAKPG